MIIEDIVGLIPSEIVTTEDTIVFTFTDGRRFTFYHSQDCCESVYIEDVNGDWVNLLNNPLLTAEERVEQPDDLDTYESVTWTFYTFRGIGGSVDVRWVGESNGYYSESVDYGFV